MGGSSLAALTFREGDISARLGVGAWLRSPAERETLALSSSLALRTRTLPCGGRMDEDG